MQNTQLSIYNFHKKHGFPVSLPIQRVHGFPRMVIKILCAVTLKVSKICLRFGKFYSKRNKYIMECFWRFHLISEELVESMLPLIDGDEEGFCDGLGDLVYVVMGSGVSFHIPLKEVMHEICKSNDTKSPRNQSEDLRLKSKGSQFIEPNFIYALETGRQRLISEGQL